MTETEHITEIPSTEEEKKEKVKKFSTPSWLQSLAIGLIFGDVSKVNFRRKHPKLGGKIADLEQRVKKLELINGRLIDVLKPGLLTLLQEKAKRYVTLNFDEIIASLGDDEFLGNVV